MLKDLLQNNIPLFNLSEIDLTSHNWDVLLSLWRQFNQRGSIEFKTEETKEGICWVIRETLRSGRFELHRSKVNYYRTTIEDTYGLLGLSLINPKDDRVILTEGVSDFFTAKFMCPTSNVLGVTTLSGSQTAKKILLNLFNKFVICSDNDATADRNTGVNNAQNLSNYLRSYGKAVNIFIPSPGCKDITDNLIYSLKINKYS